MESGEFSTVLRDESVERSDVTEIGQVISDSDMECLRDEKTVFDSTGLAVRDVVTSRMVYRRTDPEDCETFCFI